jgi:hypothetical protein
MARPIHSLLRPLAILAFSLLLSACTREAPIKESDFIGKWKSSKLETPIYLYPNGEWEIKTDAGDVLQYGIWDYDKKLVWSYKVNGSVGYDKNEVLAMAPDEFSLKEQDGSTTIFIRLGDLQAAPR